MKMRNRTFLAALAVGIMLLAYVPCACAEQNGKEINIALGKEPDDLNPIYNTGHGDFFDVIRYSAGLSSPMRTCRWSRIWLSRGMYPLTARSTHSISGRV
jgi:hypothetical protein